MLNLTSIIKDKFKDTIFSIWIWLLSVLTLMTTSGDMTSKWVTKSTVWTAIKSSSKLQLLATKFKTITKANQYQSSPWDSGPLMKRATKRMRKRRRNSSGGAPSMMRFSV